MQETWVGPWVLKTLWRRKWQPSPVLWVQKHSHTHTHTHTRYVVVVLVMKSCLTLCHYMDYSPPFSSVHGIIQARILEWVAISFSRGSSWPREQTHISSVSSIGRQILYQCATWEALTAFIIKLKLLYLASRVLYDHVSVSFFVVISYYFFFPLFYSNHRLPWWLSGKESTCQCNRHGFDIWVKKIPIPQDLCGISSFCLETCLPRSCSLLLYSDPCLYITFS